MIFQSLYLLDSSAVEVMDVQEGIVGAFYWSRKGEGVVAWGGSERFFVYGLIIVHDTIYHWFASHCFKANVFRPRLLSIFSLSCYMDIAMSIRFPSLARFSHHGARIFVVHYFTTSSRVGGLLSVLLLWALLE